MRGQTLIAILGILTILSILSLSFVYIMRTELKAVSNFATKLQADYFADAGINSAIKRLITSRKDSKGYLLPYKNLDLKGIAIHMPDGYSTPEVQIKDENSKLNLLAIYQNQYKEYSLNFLNFLEARLKTINFPTNKVSLLAQQILKEKPRNFSALEKICGKTIFQTIKPYVTFYSCETEINVSGEKRINLNTVNAYELFTILSKRIDVSHAAQLAVNLVDFRDEDNVPTLLTVGSTTYRGVEKTPYINEIMAYSATPDEHGNDGQYVELYNPYDEDISLDGWKLEGAFGTIYLYGKIAGKGYVIITDQYTDNEIADGGEADGYNFFKNYGSLPAESLIEDEKLNLIKSGDRLRLYDENGNLIDEVIYPPCRKNVSWEKNDPRVAIFYSCAGGTPNRQNFNYRPPNRSAEKSIGFIRNRRYNSLGDIGEVSTSFSDNPWSTISLDTGANKISFDQVVDLFKITDSEVTIGKININTAPIEVLAALPGVDTSLAKNIVEYRKTYGDFTQISQIMRVPGFQGIYQYDDDKDGEIDEEDEREALFKKIANWITVRSDQFTIESIGKIIKDKKVIARSKKTLIIDRSTKPVKILYSQHE